MVLDNWVKITCGLLVLALVGCGSVEQKVTQQDPEGIEDAMRARVEKIIDVNTIVVTANGMDETIHLVGIKKTGYEIPREECELYKQQLKSKKTMKAPNYDLKHLMQEVQTYRSNKAKQFARRLLRHERVLVIPLDPARDAQKHLRAMVYRESDRLFANYAIVRMGYGQVDKTTSFEQLAAFQAAQQAAQVGKLGLWGASLPEDEKTIIKPAVQQKLPEDYIVFISDKNRKYHLEHCKQLDDTRYPVQLKDAQKGKYKPCPVCCPEK